MSGFVFDAETFVCKGHGLDAGEWNDVTRQQIAQLRQSYPELGHWGDLALGSAFGAFSDDVLEVGWAVWMVGVRDEGFLTYCCWKQLKGKWTFGLNIKKAEQEVLKIWKNSL